MEDRYDWGDILQVDRDAQDRCELPKVEQEDHE